jgi:nicotinate-nucleotide adenylyltransferase
LKRVGIFGGTFDPVHDAHVALARVARVNWKLDVVLWFRAGRPWNMSGVLAPAADREAMVRLAIAGEAGFTLDRSELKRRGTSYTLDTVRELQAAAPDTEWVLIIGQDQYAGLHTWRDWRELLDLVTLAIANRPGARPIFNAEVAARAHHVVMLPMMDISPTEIRARSARGEPVDDLVPAAVARYIEAHGLYRPRNAAAPSQPA